MQANTKPKINEDTTLFISRVFDAPRTLVYKVWTDKQHLMQWFHPGDFKVTSMDMDLRVGGKYHFTWKSSEGNDYAGGGVYREIKEPSRLVYTHVWEKNCSEERQDLIGMETLITVDFIEQGDKTLVTFMHEGLPDRSTVEGHTKGWTSFLENLAKHLTA